MLQIANPETTRSRPLASVVTSQFLQLLIWNKLYAKKDIIRSITYRYKYYKPLRISFYLLQAVEIKGKKKLFLKYYLNENKYIF